jgi:hypothetical protein
MPYQRHFFLIITVHIKIILKLAAFNFIENTYYL